MITNTLHQPHKLIALFLMSDGKGDMLLMATCFITCYLAINDHGCADLSEGFVIEKHNQHF